jgi:hypothetical protein
MLEKTPAEKSKIRVTCPTFCTSRIVSVAQPAMLAGAPHLDEHF